MQSISSFYSGNNFNDMSDDFTETDETPMNDEELNNMRKIEEILIQLGD